MSTRKEMRWILAGGDGEGCIYQKTKYENEGYMCDVRSKAKT